MGDYSLQKVLEFTQKFYKNRYDYRDRDVLKRVTIKERKEINLRDPSRPQHRFQIETYSYPQYGNYIKMTGRSGRERQYQRTVRHQYDQVLTVKELSLSTTTWQYRIGSQKKWVKKPPQKKIKSLYKETKERFKRKAKRRAGNNATQREINKEYKKIVDRHKRNAKYLDQGDFNAQEMGIMADFIYRAAYAFKVHGHLYGRMAVDKPSSLNKNNIPFFNKHALRLIKELMRRGILSE